MLWLYLLAVVLLALVVAALLGRWEGAAVPEEATDLGDSDVDALLLREPARPITADDLQEVRLDSALRGYRMDQVDRLLDALGEQLRELQGLRSEPTSGAPGIMPEPLIDRPEGTTEPERGRADPAHAAPDKDLSSPSPPDPRV
ncbi:DivIVA domain-containing protein [Nesterenkonia sp. E16_7]|uniref:DivIVA domain-containing protein n=1 Tax=unclassified Nesterenkonia TaxID=2629769 RepID=UPI001A9313DF|nr:MULTISPECIES: DivIVA domain-containing protein [unclassified Nesterenkonia]MBO0594408.1 DivIVA domain-containing protein [Nesterenkonia sp. E16_10]MBO0598313.1 DivIVA domain-containing protein [Nesterenkonia sp. E16_7]